MDETFVLSNYNINNNKIKAQYKLANQKNINRTLNKSMRQKCRESMVKSSLGLCLNIMFQSCQIFLTLKHSENI